MHILSDPSAQAALWKRTRAMCARAVDAIGEPQALAARGALARKAKHEIAGWIARLESIVRKLLLALAAALFKEAGRAERKAPEPQRSTARISQPHAPRPALDCSAPQTWPARFALAPPRDPHLVPECRAPRISSLYDIAPPATPQPAASATPTRTEPALRFAFRLEALKRVLADPIPYARRLGRIMRRLIRRYPHAADRYATTSARPCVGDEGDPRLIIDAISAAMFGAPVLAADTS